MPDLIDEFGDPDGGAPRQAALARIAHLTPWAVAIGGPVALASYFVTWGPFVLTGAVIVSGAVATSIIGSAHRAFGRICVRCMNEVPADAPLRAQRRRYRAAMREAHRPLLLGTLRRPGAVAMLALTLAPYLAGSLFLHVSWFGAPMAAWCFWRMLADWVHHRYKPWCPECKWGDGGSPERVPDPDPVESGTK